VPHLFHFICISKQLKNNILLTQPPEEPEDEAPEVLPPSVTKLLADEKVVMMQFGIKHLTDLESNP
jgi:hypothetical protein